MGVEARRAGGEPEWRAQRRPTRRSHSYAAGGRSEHAALARPPFAAADSHLGPPSWPRSHLPPSGGGGDADPRTPPRHRTLAAPRLPRDADLAAVVDQAMRECRPGARREELLQVALDLDGILLDGEAEAIREPA